mgnify:CR=1 FL=1
MVTFNDKVINNRLDDLRRQEEEKLVQALAPQYGLEYINLHGYTINPEAVGLIPEVKANAAAVVAFDYSHTAVSVALKRPQDALTIKLLEELAAQTRLAVIPYLCSQSSLEHGWKRYADLVTTEAKKQGVFDISAEDIKNFVASIKTKEDVAKLMSGVSGVNNARRVTETLELVFAGALALRASDIHIEPEESGVRLRYRLDGMLFDIFDIDRFIYERLISRLKLLAGMTLNQRQMAQDGRFTFDASDREVEIRASIIPGSAGESMVMRILDPSVASFTLDKIDLNPILYEVMKRELKKPNGLIITTGTTGSGKTTALYAFLREAHEEGVKIITIENPVEYKIEGIVQTQTGDDYTFASGLRAVLRQDPDIIMVGEIRDQEVAQTAIHAAQTGHLVFSTLHTNSAVGGFPRLIDLGIDAGILGSAINVLLGQRLVRRLCDKCKAAYQADEKERGILQAIMSTHPRPTPVPEALTLYKPVGCTACGGTGYKGRVGIFEAEAVEEAIVRGPREHVILAAAESQNIPTMVEDGGEKVMAGITSLAELERVVELPRPNAAPPAKVSDEPQNTEAANTTPEDVFLAHVVK